MFRHIWRDVALSAAVGGLCGLGLGAVIVGAAEELASANEKDRIKKDQLKMIESSETTNVIESQERMKMIESCTRPKTPKSIHKEYTEAIQRADQMIRRFKEEQGVPGIAVGVLMNRKVVWKMGYGYADVENLVECTGDSAMRIGSISKPLTMTLAAKLMQEGKLDLDAPIQKYVPLFPEKEVDGEKVCITTRHLVSHFGGLRHYDKPKTPDTAANGTTVSADQNADASKQLDDKKNVKKDAEEALCEKCQSKISTQGPTSEFQYDEYYSQTQYNSVTDALSMFKDDPLIAKPGTKFLYTTHGWTLVSAVIEGASGRSFPDSIKELFRLFNMRETCLDENYPLIPNRTRYYRRRSENRNRLENVPSVNNSYKWAGGGIVSTVDDLLRFANALFYFYHNCPGDVNRNGDCYLNRKTLDQVWTRPKYAPANCSYAMGWVVVPDTRIGNQDQFYVSHTGGSVGASCVLLLKPNTRREGPDIAVAVLTNFQECSGLSPLAQSIADVFDRHTGSTGDL